MCLETEGDPTITVEDLTIVGTGQTATAITEGTQWFAFLNSQASMS